MIELEKNYDLIVIGGGINGAAIARDAALRGLKTILFEKNDFASGTSSKSSKMIHGGLRYLQSFEFHLVKECLEERQILLQNAPHLVKLLPFLVPIYRESKWPLWKLKAGLYIYDFLTPPSDSKHININKTKFKDLIPAIKQNNLRGGCLYYDAIMQDSRLVLENILSAEEAGAQAFNYTPVEGVFFENSRVAGVILEQGQRVNATCVVNATGVWTDSVINWDENSPKTRLKPSKGVHLVLPSILSTHALLLTTPQDNRIFFILPWNGFSLLGTTETPYRENFDQVEVTEKDEHYLIDAYNAYFPDHPISREKVIAAFAGLRPLAASGRSNLSKVSRGHHIDVSPHGIISVYGGKYTSHRLIAEEVLDTVCKRHFKGTKKCDTKNKPLYGAADKAWIDVSMDKVWKVAQENAMSVESAKHLVSTYGSSVKTILQIIRKTPGGECQICSLHPHVYAEITYAIHYEKAKTLEDWYYRRTNIGYCVCQARECLEKTADKFAAELHWDITSRNHHVQEYLDKTLQKYLHKGFL